VTGDGIQFPYHPFEIYLKIIFVLFCLVVWVFAVILDWWWWWFGPFS
jgi:hypothetical protein